MKTPSVIKSKTESLVLAPPANRSTEEQDRIRFLNLRRLPARLTVQQTAWVLGVRPHSIQVLVSHRLLKPIGAPARNETKSENDSEPKPLGNAKPPPGEKGVGR